MRAVPDGFDRAVVEAAEPDDEGLVETLTAAGVAAAGFTEKAMLRRQVDVTTSTLVVARLPSIRAALKILGCSDPAPIDYPESLRSFLHRRVWPSTMGAARSLVERSGQPVFVKPATDRKRFTGTVMTEAEQWPIGNAPGDLPVWCSEPVTWRSEHRAFIADGDVVGVRHYWGDPAVEPDPSIVAVMVDAYADDAPRSFALDVGVLSDGTTALVEVNDGYSLGRYGLGADAYLRVLSARWRQLVG